jgi:hypothetical protein
MVVSAVENGGLRIRPVNVVLDELCALVRPALKASGDSVEAFIAERRAEAAREATDDQDHAA